MSDAVGEPLDLVTLLCFVEAYRQPSFRAAAAAVHLSPAAFGERVARLEERLGVQLFVRSTRRVEPTHAAHRLLPRAEALLSAERDLRRLPLGLDAPALPFALTVGTRYELGLSWVLPALPELARARPERTLHLAFGDTAALLRQLEARTIDALISSARLSLAGLAYVALHDETYAFVGASELVKRTPLRGPEDAPRHTLVDARPDLPLFRYLLDAVPPEPSWTFAAHSYLGTIAAVRARVVEGYGLGVLPAYYVADDLSAGRLTRLCPGLTLQQDVFRLVWREGHPLDGELRHLGHALAARPVT